MKAILFVGALTFFALSACSTSATLTPISTSIQTSEQSDPIKYASVAEALSDLKARNDVSVEVSQGWTTITEADGLTMWSFAPPTHPANPAVAKRVISEDQDGWHIQMSILCEAEKVACDQFAKDFEALNEQMQQYIEQQHSP